MTHYEVVISEQAEEDIAKIYSYIYYDLGSEINANAVLDRLYAAIEQLSFVGESYHLYPNEPWRSRGIHYFSVNNYSVFYTTKDSIITVIHVAYGRRDLDRMLED